ncbi:MAG TPA: EutN/CcmL family microcompartment protein [Candidatus Polarisedimenticolia bacterium]|nr:EutN/CcmL family microcompartment protein [Candidatus Polarisedimenticolia bacterium]
MNLARIIGRIVATQKEPGLEGRKLLLLAPLDSHLNPKGPAFVAVDAVGAGAAEVVIYVRGREAAHAFLPDDVPTDAGVVGIVDSADVES